MKSQCEIIHSEVAKISEKYDKELRKICIKMLTELITSFRKNKIPVYIWEDEKHTSYKVSPEWILAELFLNETMTFAIHWCSLFHGPKPPEKKKRKK